jgi:hypothetical protein
MKPFALDAARLAVDAAAKRVGATARGDQH